MPQFICYMRVSTKEQGRSGLGLDAQARELSAFLASIEGGFDAPRKGQNPTDTLAQQYCSNVDLSQHSCVLATFTDVLSGAQDDRPQLAMAMALARKTGATLLVSKLDRLSRDVEFLAKLMKDSKLRLTVAAMPTASVFALHLFAALAQEERAMISARTKAALASAKARGVKLGNPRLSAINSGNARRADAHAAKVAPIAVPMREAGASLQAISDALNAAGIGAARGGPWFPATVQRVLTRLDKQAA